MEVFSVFVSFDGAEAVDHAVCLGASSAYASEAPKGVDLIGGHLFSCLF